MTYQPVMSAKAVLHANFGPNQSVMIKGTIPCEADRFHVNFVNSKTRNIHFHVNPRFPQGEIVRNALIDGTWGTEEKEMTSMPFTTGQRFMMVISNEGKYFGVYSDEKKLFSFTHRLPFSQIDMIEIGADVDVTCVQF